MTPDIIFTPEEQRRLVSIVAKLDPAGFQHDAAKALVFKARGAITDNGDGTETISFGLIGEVNALS